MRMSSEYRCCRHILNRDTEGSLLASLFHNGTTIAGVNISEVPSCELV